MRVHGLDPSVSPKEFIHLPAEFGVDLPSESAIGKLRHRDYYGDDNGQYVYGNVGNSLGVERQGRLDFLDLDDCVDKEEGVEYSKMRSRSAIVVLSNEG